MQTTSVKLYSLNYRQAVTYGAALLFVAGNIAMPQLCHLVPQGGLILLPIYFFTLIGAYKYGWRVGLLTAVLSPLANNLLFGMPPAPMLAPILVKSVLLALAAGDGRVGYDGQRDGRIAGFPSRYPGYGIADRGRISLHKISAAQVTAISSIQKSAVNNDRRFLFYGCNVVVT